ncbi:hypothetical protein [Pseudohongiella spirulinae]|uniref:Alpha/beta hydrolase n=1 Tax=Pseudohongiella spirulinae TaxID=1249552 RepID=A0A0S2KDI6_9GAMM|nr:hypothetical protein [Pseudohongiella spirulinae]ALO46378.1 hypothetical protein PS2015_1727 [Pseudohongiella spirulinae]
MCVLIIRRLLILSLLCACFSARADLSADDVPHFEFSDWSGPELRVWYELPDNFHADMPIVFVMHGVGRDADRYYAEWREYAHEYDFVLLVPEFSDADFPGAAGYNLGNVFDASGAMNPESIWSYSALDPIFEHVASELGSNRENYRLYGHSAGAQYAHRFLLYKPAAKVELAIVANAGWYTMPDASVEFPYGLRSSGIDAMSLTPLLGRHVTVLLGEEDTDPAHPSLRVTPEANAQGAHRFARGQAFYQQAMSLAARMNVPFAWQLQTVAGAAHNNSQMAEAAAPVLGR